MRPDNFPKSVCKLDNLRNLRPFLTVFQLFQEDKRMIMKGYVQYQEDGRMMMKGCGQWNPSTVEMNSPRAGLEHGTV